MSGGHREGRDELPAAELGEELAHVVIARQLLATRHDDADRTVDDMSYEHGEDLAGAAVGPVDVLEHEHERIGCVHRVHHREQALQDLLGGKPRDRRRRAFGAAARHRGAQQLDQGRVPQGLVAERHTSAGQHRRARRARFRRELGDQARLAAAGVAAQEERAGPTGRDARAERT